MRCIRSVAMNATGRADRRMAAAHVRGRRRRSAGIGAAVAAYAETFDGIHPGGVKPSQASAMPEIASRKNF